MKHMIISGAAIAMLAIAGQSAAANLIVNGGFEQTNNGFSETQTPLGWTNVGHTDGVIAYSVFNTPAYEGSYFYDEGGYGDASNAPGDGIEQTIATNPGQTYTLRYGLTGENVSGVELSDVLINGALAQQETLTVNSSYGELAAPFSTYTLTFTATGASTTIAFVTDANSPSFGNNDPMIDGISVDVGGVPEPASWALMLTGFGLAGAMVRSRKAPARA